MTSLRQIISGFPLCSRPRERARSVDFEFKIQNPKSRIQNPSGATLTEVLMALLIMAVGIVSVFTLFPISILLSIQSTKLTNARIHKNNVEQLVISSTGLLYLHRPVNASPGFRGPWQPGATYQAGDICVPKVAPGAVFPTPGRWFMCTVSSVPTGIVEPQWNSFGPTVESRDSTTGNPLLVWQPLPVIPLNPATGVPFDPSNPGAGAVYVSTHQYVLDPLGWNIAAVEGNVEHPFEFGNKTDIGAFGNSLWTLGGGGAADRPLLRINGSLEGEFAAMQVATLPDSWETVVEAVPADLNRDTSGAYPTRYAEFGPTIDLRGVAQTLAALQARAAPSGSLNGISPRIILTTADGQLTAVRELDVQRSSDAISLRRVHWADNQPLPDSFLARDVGLARIEFFDRRYTWMMTVRKPAIEWDIDGDNMLNPLLEDGNLNGQLDRGDANLSEMKLVVFFKRTFTAADEHVYFANFGNGAVDLEGDGNDDATQHGLGTRADWVKIVWNPNSAGPAPQNEPAPHYKPGNYLFDARDVTWYRIQDVYDEGTAAGYNYAVLVLDRTVRSLTPPDTMNTPPRGNPAGRAILMRGIVEIFDL